MADFCLEEADRLGGVEGVEGQTGQEGEGVEGQTGWEGEGVEGRQAGRVSLWVAYEFVVPVITSVGFSGGLLTLSITRLFHKRLK